jgi:hypothetical protein
VIATGLEDDRPGRGLHRESAVSLPSPPRLVEMPRRESPPAYTAEAVAEMPVDPPASADPAATDGWPVDSPYEDELDVPTFLRNRTRTADAEDEDDAFEDPAFLRRSAD